MKFFYLLFFTTLFLLNISTAIAASERFTSIDSEIYIRKDGVLEVTENLTVLADNQKILHGIYRDFPQVYNDSLFKKSLKSFSVMSVLKDGSEEPYSLIGLDNGTRVKIGSPDLYVTPGKHTYTVKYQTADQLGFFNNYVQLYFNIIGNDFLLDVDSVTAKINFPETINPNSIKFWSFLGPQGSLEEGNYFKFTNNTLIIKSGRKLAPGEAFTVMVQFPKNVVEQPFYKKYLPAYLTSKQSLFGIAYLTIFLILFKIFNRRYHSKRCVMDNPPVMFDLPKNLSASSIGFINQVEGNNLKSDFVSIAILELAINGYIQITEDNKGVKAYILTKTNKSPDDLLEDQLFVYETIFEDKDSLKLITSRYNEKIGLLALENISSYLKTYKKYYTNEFITYFIALSAFVLFLISNFIIVNSEYLFLANSMYPSTFILFLTYNFIFFPLGYKIYLDYKSGNLNNTFTVLWMLSKTVFLIIGLATLFVYSVESYTLFGALALTFGLFLMSITFKRRAMPSPETCDNINHINGFKLFAQSQDDYLSAVKMDLPQKFNMYEKYLPFALALGLETVWSEKFKSIIDEVKQLNLPHYNNWYVGTSSLSSFNYSEFNKNFSTSISSAQIDPSTVSSSGGFSSGGSSSGGSSGGGGGGGGGGGW